MRFSSQHQFGLAPFVAGVALFTAVAAAHADSWRPLYVPAPPPPPVAPDARLLHTAIYDPEYGMMIVYGGLAGGNVFSNVLGLNLAHPDTWHLITPVVGGIASPERRDHVSIYDAPRNRMVVFGGCSTESNFSATNDVFAFGLGAAPQWQRIAPEDSASGPSARFSLCGIYDPVRERLVIFGGATNQGVFLNEVWTLSLTGTPHWTQMTPQGTPPSARDALSAVYDPVRDRMIVFGGWNGTQYLNDTWALSLAGDGAWEQLSTGGETPSPRRHPALVYDAAQDRVIVTGGIGESGYLNDIHALSLGGDAPTWAGLSAGNTAPPSGRFGHRAIYDPVGARLVLFAGYGLSGGNEAYLADTWSYALGSDDGWTRIAGDSVPPVSGGDPGGRRDHVAAIDAAGDRMIVFGGSNGIQNLNDTWALSLTGDPVWTFINAQGPLPSRRFSLAGAMDTTRRRLLVFGGYDGVFLNQLWALGLDGTPAWSNLTPASGPAPSPRNAMSAIYDPLGDRMLVFGGWTGSAFKGDLWSFEFSGDSPGWHELDAGPGPSVRRHYGLAYDATGPRMILSGGETGAFADSAWSVHNLSDTWALDLDPAHTPAWTLVNDDTSDVPPARNGQRAIVSAGGRFLQFGGSNTIYCNDTWSFGPSNTWSELSADDGHGLPPGRTLATFAYDAEHSRAILYGGEGEGGYDFPDLWELRLESESGAGKIVDTPPGGTVALAIRRIAPNPAHGPIDVWFTLPRAGGATLGLYDVAGRRVLGRDLGTMTSGEHRVNLAAAGAVAPGVYFVVLGQDGVVRKTKVAILK